MPASASSPAAGLPTADFSDASTAPRPEVGKSWLGRYEIKQELRTDGGGRCFAGVRTKDGVPVLLRELAADADTPTRAKVWNLLTKTPVPSAAPLLETVPLAQGRIEVSRSCESALTEWLALQTMEPAAVMVVIKSLARALLALHERGLVYLRLNPAVVFLDGEGLDSAVLTQVEECALIGQEATVENPLDPTRVPPEGFEQTALRVDETLKAWDWWSLGRLAQELVLGQPMIVQLVGRDVPRLSPEVRQQAEVLLREIDPTGTRAGAVELMPDLPPDLTLFLRGVLTTMRQGRWSDAAVRSWLEGKRPAERYLLPPGSQYISVGEENLILPDAAERMGRDEHWAWAAEQFKAEEPVEGTPAHALLANVDAYVTEREWFMKVRELREAAAFRQFPVDARTEALAALAWLGVAPAGTKLRWRGRPIDMELLREMAQDDAGMARARVLCARAFADVVQQRDATLAWSLRTWGQEWDEAEAVASKNRWLKVADARRRLVNFVFRGGEARAQAVQAGREKFHLTSVEALQAIYGAERPSSAHQIVLAYTLERPTDFGYITHHKWLLMEQDRLRGRAETLSRGIQSLRSARAVRVGVPAFSGSLGWWSGAAAIVAAVAILWPGVPATFLTLVVVGAAALLRTQLAVALRMLAPPEEGQPWRWSGVLRRLYADAKAASGVESLPSVGQLQAELARVNKELTSLKLEPAPVAIRLGPRPFGLWTTAIISWVVVVGLLSFAAWQAQRAQWTPEYVKTTWVGDFEKISEAWASSTFPDLSLTVTPPPPAWPFVPSGVIHPVGIVERVSAEERQFVLMKAFLLTLQQNYEPRSMSGLIAAEVPLPDGRGSGLMVLDVATGKLASPLIFRLEQMPVRGMTIDLDGIQAMYLNGP